MKKKKRYILKFQFILAYNVAVLVIRRNTRHFLWIHHVDTKYQAIPKGRVRSDYKIGICCYIAL